jgi:hypothetical protein
MTTDGRRAGRDAFDRRYRRISGHATRRPVSPRPNSADSGASRQLMALAASTYIRSGASPTKVPLATVRGHRLQGGWDPSIWRRIEPRCATGHIIHLGISNLAFLSGYQIFKTARSGTRPLSRYRLGAISSLRAPGMIVIRNTSLQLLDQMFSLCSKTVFNVKEELANAASKPSFPGDSGQFRGRSHSLCGQLDCGPGCI